MGHALFVVRGVETLPSNDEEVYGFIDIWWIAEQGQLLFIVAYLLKQSSVWSHCRGATTDHDL